MTQERAGQNLQIKHRLKNRLKIIVYMIIFLLFFPSLFYSPLPPPPDPTSLPTPPSAPACRPSSPPPPPPTAHNWCSFVTCVTWMHRRVVLWDWELMHFQAYVYIIFVYHFVYVDMSTRSSQINHLSLESWVWCWEYKHTVMMTLLHRFLLNYFLLHIFNLKLLRLWL